MAQAERKDINKRFDYLREEPNKKIEELRTAVASGATKAELVELIEEV